MYLHKQGTVARDNNHTAMKTCAVIEPRSQTPPSFHVGRSKVIRVSGRKEEPGNLHCCRKVWAACVVSKPEQP